MSFARPDDAVESFYKSLVARVLDIQKEDSGADAVSKATAAIGDTSQVVKNVTKPRQIGLDARVLELSSAVVQQNAEIIDAVFRPFEYADKLVNLLVSKRHESSPSETLIWSRFSEEFGYLLPLRPSFDYIYGTYDREGFKPKERAPRNFQRQKVMPKEVIKTLSEKDNERSDGTLSQQEILDRICSKIHKLYKKSGSKPVNYFEFILNPKSFEETCQNILNVAFLVRDSLLRMYMENDELLMVPIKPKRDDMGGLQKEELKRQFLIQMSRSDWKELVEAYQITEPMIDFGLVSQNKNVAGKSGRS